MNQNPAVPPPEPDELVRSDDAIIGLAVRWSLGVVLVLAVAGGGVFFLLKHKRGTAPPRVSQFTPPATPHRSQAEIPVAKFTDITQASGITFSQVNGAYGEKLLPETMGGGVAFFDFDNDGAQDLLLINATYWPGKVPPDKQPTTMVLYHNDGKGHFTDVTAGSGVDVSFYGMGVAIGDYDNDGLPDVFLTAVGGNHLFHNEGNGKFAEVTAAAGVGGTGTDWSTSAAWIDYDNDGKL